MSVCAVAAAAAAAAGVVLAGHGPSDDARRLALARTVVNLEYTASDLVLERPDSVLAVPRTEGVSWFGQVTRRTPGESFLATKSSVAFLVEYVGGVASRAWCDTGLDGSLADDPPLPLSAYPGRDGRRSFLAALVWTVAHGTRRIPVAWTVRVVLEPADRPGRPPLYRLQMVHGMAGTVALEGGLHRAVLFDGNADGIFTKDLGDGVFVDLDDDLHFDIDMMSPEFGPLRVPFQMGRSVYEALEVDPEGRSILLRRSGPGTPAAAAKVGSPAPEFTHRDLAGRELRLGDLRGRTVLLYFWASWCGSSASQATRLEAFLARRRPEGVQFLGVSLDTDRLAMEAFRRRHAFGWPTAFSGRMPWEEPLARAFRVDSPGTFVLIDRAGIFRGAYSDLDALDRGLAGVP